MYGRIMIQSCSNLFTLFVDNIPDSKDLIWLKRTFSDYGIVKDVYIPAKRSKKGSKFGFVRYDCSVSAGIAIYRANGLKVDGRHLHVKKASFELDSNRNEIRKINGSKQGEERRQKCMEYKVVEGKSYAQAVKTVESHDFQSIVASIHIEPSGNGWLHRSAIAKIRKLLSTEELEKEFKLEDVQEVQIKALGGRFVILTFPNEESRDATLKERWVMNWFEEINPWNGDSAKDERFVWLSCFGMPLNAWSSQTFKEIGDKWGNFIQVDDNTLRGKSYEKGRILIATEQLQRIEGKIELIISGNRYIIRVEEEESFRKVVSSKAFIDLDLESEKVVDMTQNNDDKMDGLIDVEASNDGVETNKIKYFEDDKYSKVPKKAQFLETETGEECNEANSNSVHGLESWVEDSAGPYLVTHQDHGSGIKAQYCNDQNLEIPTTIEKVENSGRDLILMKEPLVIDSGNNLRASQIEGINLLVDLRPAERRRRIRSQMYEACMGPEQSDFVPNSISSQRTRQDHDIINDELQATINVGKLLGVDMVESDILQMKNMIEIEAKEFALRQRSTYAC